MILLHTTNCPKCKVLKKKLELAEIKFDINDDVALMLEKGFAEAPVLELEDGELLPFTAAISWVNEIERSK